MENRNEELYRFVTERLPLEKGQRFVIGVDGLSRSGKTTLTHRIESALRSLNIQVAVFHLDDHIVERGRRYDTGHAQWHEYYRLQWDIEELRGALFEKLKNEKEIVLPFYEEEADRQVLRKIQLPETCVMIVEGVFLQRKEWRTYLDFVLYLDCPREIRFARESESTQKKLRKFTERYWKAEDYYLANVRPHTIADAVQTAPSRESVVADPNSKPEGRVFE